MGSQFHLLEFVLLPIGEQGLSSYIKSQTIKIKSRKYRKYKNI